MHIENLKIFSDLVESESFSRAAKLNGITQSAVSQQLRAMEKHFNVLIVDRSQKQFRLTREGNKIYDSAKDILHQYDQLNSELQEMKKVISGTIQLSTIYSIGLHELPPYIKKFMQEFPSVNVRVEYRRAYLVYEDVLQNCVDLGLVAYPNKMRQLEILPFAEDELVMIAAPSNPISQNVTINIQQMNGQKIIGFEQDIPTRRATDQIFKEADIQLEPSMEFDNIETVKRAVEIDAGVAIVPSATVNQEVSQGLLKKVRIRNISAMRPLAIVHRKGRVLTPAMKKFISLLTGKPNEKVKPLEEEE